jgi:rhodanese-related sulfurtransferase
VRSDQLRPADAKKKVTPLPNPGVQEVTLEEVVHCFRDPEYAPGQADSRYLFLDARNDADYQEGHIPGALQVDHYYKDEYLPDLLPRIDSAEHVIIYCNGDDCEDSILVCMDLLDEGVPARKLMLFRDGWEGWVKAKCAVETEGD